MSESIITYSSILRNGSESDSPVIDCLTVDLYQDAYPKA